VIRGKAGNGGIRAPGGPAGPDIPKPSPTKPRPDTDAHGENGTLKNAKPPTSLRTPLGTAASIAGARLPIQTPAPQTTMVYLLLAYVLAVITVL